MDMQNYYGFNGDGFVLLGNFQGLDEAFNAAEKFTDECFFFITDERSWKGIFQESPFVD